MNEAVVEYSVDTSALIDGLERYYPEETFPALWSRVDELIDGNRFYVSEEVWEEAQAKTAVTKEWCSARRDVLVIPTDAEIAAAVTQILGEHERLVMGMKGRNRADPFVIALARIRGATVVTGEGADGTANRPKIPFICGEIGVPCIRFLDLIKGEGWRFD